MTKTPTLSAVLSSLFLFTLSLPLPVRQNAEPGRTASDERPRPAITSRIIEPEGLSPKQQVDPSYPPLAQLARVQGSVSLDAAVEADGSVSDIWVISGHPLLVKAALTAVQQWKFDPTPQLPTHARVMLQFRLTDAAASPNPRPPTAEAKYLRPDLETVVYADSPDYPPKALRRSIEGTVLLEVTLDPDRKITDLRVLKSDGDLLTPSAVIVIQRIPQHFHYRWGCNPGETSPCIKRVVVNYELNPLHAPRYGPLLDFPGKIIAAPPDLMVIRGTLAVYPAMARKNDVQGHVQIKLTLDSRGDISDAEVLSGPEPLQAAALRAAVKMGFAPLSAAPAEVTLDYDFWVPK